MPHAVTGMLPLTAKRRPCCSASRGLFTRSVVCLEPSSGVSNAKDVIFREQILPRLSPVPTPVGLVANELRWNDTFARDLGKCRRCLSAYPELVTVSRVADATMALVSVRPEALPTTANQGGSGNSAQGIPPYPPPGANDEALVATITSILERKGAVEVAALPGLLGGWDTMQLGRVFDVVAHRPDRFAVELAHSTSAKVRVATDNAGNAPTSGCSQACDQGTLVPAAGDDVDDVALLWEHFGGSEGQHDQGSAVEPPAAAAAAETCDVGAAEIVVEESSVAAASATVADIVPFAVGAKGNASTEDEDEVEPSFDVGAAAANEGGSSAVEASPSSEPLPANSFHLKVFPNIPADGSWVGLAELSVKARWSPGVQRRFGPLVVQLEGVYGSAVEVDHKAAACRRRRGSSSSRKVSGENDGGDCLDVDPAGGANAAGLDPNQCRTILEAVPWTAPVALDDLVVVVSGLVTAAEAAAALKQREGHDVLWSTSVEGTTLVQRSRPPSGVKAAPRAMILCVLAQHLRTEGASLSGLEAATQWAQNWGPRFGPLRDALSAVSGVVECSVSPHGTTLVRWFVGPSEGRPPDVATVSGVDVARTVRSALISLRPWRGQTHRRGGGKGSHPHSRGWLAPPAQSDAAPGVGSTPATSSTSIVADSMSAEGNSKVAPLAPTGTMNDAALVALADRAVSVADGLGGALPLASLAARLEADEGEIRRALELRTRRQGNSRSSYADGADPQHQQRRRTSSLDRKRQEAFAERRRAETRSGLSHVSPSDVVVVPALREGRSGPERLRADAVVHRGPHRQRPDEVWVFVDALGVAIRVAGEDVPALDVQQRPVGWRRLHAGTSTATTELKEAAAPDQGGADVAADAPTAAAAACSPPQAVSTSSADGSERCIAEAVAQAEAGRREAEAALDAAMRRWVLAE